MLAGLPGRPIRHFLAGWDTALESVQNEGKLYSFFPADFALPMVAPADIGRIAARLLTEPIENTGIRYVEGPARYSPQDVARAFEQHLKRPVEVAVIPEEAWQETMRGIGFSEKAARSFAGMTKATLEAGEQPENPVLGSMTIGQYIRGIL